MKDFKEAAKDYYKKNMIMSDTSLHPLVAFESGCNHGYSEAKKEVRELLLNIRSLIKDGPYHYAVTQIDKSLASFTDQEQKELL